MNNNDKYLFLISGAAGAGKTTLAEKLMELSGRYMDSPIKDICEADTYWYIRGKGKYAFDMNLLPKSHEWCQNNVKNLMKDGFNLIVSNTNINPEHRRVYFELAEEYGYKIIYIHLTTQFQNRHNVPDSTVARMRNNYISPNLFEKERIMKYDEMPENLKKLLHDVGIDKAKYEN